MSPRDVEQASKQIDDCDEAYQPDRWNVSMIVMANKCNAKVAPLIAENEMLRWERDVAGKNARAALAEVKEIGMLLGAEANKNQKLTEQNRELESIVSKRVPKLEKILSIMKEALASYVRWCPFGCVEGDCGAEWDAEPKPCDACKPAREALAAVKKLEE